MKKTCAIVVAILIGVLALKADPVTWSFKLIDDTDHPTLQITAKIAPGFHLYNFDHGGMENPLKITITPEGATLVGTPTPNKAATAETDEDGMPARYFSDSVTFTQKLEPTAEKYNLTIKITGQACDANSCSNINVAKKMSSTVRIPGSNSQANKATQKVNKSTQKNKTNNKATQPSTRATKPVDKKQPAKKPASTTKQKSSVVKILESILN